MFEYYTCTTTRPTCTRGRRRRIVRKKKKDNSKFYFEIKIDTLMIGARKCQVKQVEREFYFTALTREDIADLFEGHWPTFATTNVVNNNTHNARN